jgi:hypothetical protein
MRLPLLILNSDSRKGRWKPDVDWDRATSITTGTSPDKVVDAVVESFVQADASKVDRDELIRHSSLASGRLDVRSLIKNVMALPEFQLI